MFSYTTRKANEKQRILRQYKLVLSFLYKFFKIVVTKRNLFYTNKVKGGKVMQNMEEIYNKY